MRDPRGVRAELKREREIELPVKWDYADLLVQFGITDTRQQAQQQVQRARNEHTLLQEKATQWLKVLIIKNFLTISKIFFKELLQKISGFLF